MLQETGTVSVSWDPYLLRQTLAFNHEDSPEIVLFSPNHSSKTPTLKHHKAYQTKARSYSKRIVLRIYLNFHSISIVIQVLLLHFLILLMCIHVWRKLNNSWESVLSPHGTWRSDSDHQVWQKEPALAEPSHRPIN